MGSRRMNSMPVSPIVKYYNIVEKLEQKGVRVIKANIGQPMNEINQYYYHKINYEKLSVNLYSSSYGLDLLRKRVADLYNAKIKKSQYKLSDVVVTQGASDGIIKVLYSICDEEDEVIVLEPFFSDYKLYCSLLKLKMIPLKYDDLSLENLNKLYSPKVKAILFANPNNPDGRVLNKNDIAILKKFSLKHQVFIISDEVYNDIVFTPSFTSMSTLNNKNVIVVDSASKKLNCCGSRIGFIVTKNKEIIDDIALLNDITISISNTEQIGVIGLLEKYFEIVKTNKNHYEKQLNIVKRKLSGNKKGITFSNPSGGISLLINLPIKNSDDYIEWLLKKYRSSDNSTLLLTSAKGFYVNCKETNSVRFCYTMSRGELIKALDLLLDSIDVYNKRS